MQKSIFDFADFLEVICYNDEEVAIMNRSTWYGRDP